MQDGIDTQIYNMIDRAKTVNDLVNVRTKIVNNYHKDDRNFILDEIKYMFCEKKINYQIKFTIKFISQIYNKWLPLSSEEKKSLKKITGLCKNFIEVKFKRKSRKVRKSKRKSRKVKKSKRKSRKSRKVRKSKRKSKRKSRKVRKSKRKSRKSKRKSRKVRKSKRKSKKFKKV